MRSSQRIVTHFPLEDLWDDAGSVPGTRGAPLRAEELRERLRQGPVRFVVADCGCPLRWVSETDRYGFWKNEVRPRLLHPAEAAWDLTSMPGGYGYLALLWRVSPLPAVVLLEVYH